MEKKKKIISEYRLQCNILKYLKTLGYPIKLSQRTNCGDPDIVMCVKGKFVAIELKKPSEVPSKLQSYTLKKISEEGGIVCIATSLDDIKKIFDNICLT